MNKKSIIANGVYLDDVKDLLRTGQRMAISTSTFEKIIDSLEEKFQECESLKEQNETFHKMLNAPEVRVALTDVRTGEREVQAKIRRRLEKENVNNKQALAPFEDEYFKGLDTKQIAELAKKSIRLTTENRKLEDAIGEIEEYTKTTLRMPLERRVILDIISKVK